MEGDSPSGLQCRAVFMVPSASALRPRGLGAASQVPDSLSLLIWSAVEDVGRARIGRAKHSCCRHGDVSEETCARGDVRCHRGA